jgi:beta-xylosidase
MGNRQPAATPSEATRTYTNPVYAGYFADPFVWEYGARYYAIGTGGVEAHGEVEETGAARVFPLLVSEDLVEWRFVHRALLRSDPALGDDFWAPEVAHDDGKFYLYYSVGQGDKNHQLRVAISETPEGPYRDTGRALTDLSVTPFAIDPHPFRDDDGQWYLFYARDFLDTEGGARVGTGIAVDRLEGMTKLAGEERTVVRPRFDWQRFQRDRPMYGGIYDWHTVEGACVREHEGRYYCLYSGGRWETASYGVDYVVADRATGPYADAGGEAGPRVLRSVPGRVRGPGHNSIVRGPDGRSEYVVYHAWDAPGRARQMWLDRLLWTPDGPRCDGPSDTPQRIVLKASGPDSGR